MYTVKMTSCYSALSGLNIEVANEYGSAVRGAILIGLELSDKYGYVSLMLQHDSEPIAHFRFHDGKMQYMETLKVNEVDMFSAFDDEPDFDDELDELDDDDDV